MLSKHTHTLLIFISLSCFASIDSLFNFENFTLSLYHLWDWHLFMLQNGDHMEHYCFLLLFLLPALHYLSFWMIYPLTFSSVMFMYVCRSLFFHVKWWHHSHHSLQRFFIKICEKFPTTQRKAFIIAVSLLRKERYYWLCFSLEIVPFLIILNLIISYSLLRYIFLVYVKKSNAMIERWTNWAKCHKDDDCYWSCA